jgi:two-component system chemotaxis sensor kinase CheA
MDLPMLPDFTVEAMEHLEEMENSLLQLEQDHENVDILNEVFRSIHSIKGAAQYIGLERVSELSHRLESLLDLIRQGKKPLNDETIDIFITAKDRINSLVNELESSQTEDSDIEDLLQRINIFLDELPQGKDDRAIERDAAREKANKNLPQLVNQCQDEEYDE